MTITRSLIAGVLLLMAAPAAAQPTPAQRLAGQFACNAGLVVEIDPLTSEALGTAILLMQEATRLAPDDADLWRRLLQLAALADREDLRDEAITRIAELDPRDEVIRLRRLGLLIDREQSAEARVAAYERLLAPGARDKLSKPMASRLALELASLHRLRGDERAFHDRLREAVTLDPGNRDAAALAVTAFMPSLRDDVYAQAELMLNLVLADPTEIPAQIGLGRLLIEHGAYVGAARLLDNAEELEAVAGLGRTPGLAADVAIAHWAGGDPEVALEIVDREQRRANEAHRILMRDEQPELTPLDLARLTGTLDPTLATVRAAITNQRGADEAAAALRSAVTSFEEAIEAASAPEDGPDAVVAGLSLEQAWLLLWLGGDADRAADLVARAGELKPLSEDAKQRFAGWTAFRQGRLDEAAATLTPLIERDPPARLGLALVRRESDRKLAARHLLAVARAQPGSLLGVWAANTLYEMIGQRVPINMEAARLERLIESVPATIDRYAEDPTLCIGLRVSSARPTFDPYRPVEVEVEVINNSRYPLAIDGDGPIQPQLLLLTTARVARAREVGTLKPIVVDIDRTLTLAPRERLVVPVDLSRYHAGRVFNERPLPGAIVRARIMSNFAAGADGMLRPALLGSEAESQPFRVDGVRIGPRWMDEALAEVVAADRAPDLDVMATLSHVAAVGVAGGLPAQKQQVFADAVAALAEAYARLDPISQAWLLGIMHEGPAIEPILAMARKSESRLVKIAYLIYCLEGTDDPMLDAARRGDDLDLRRLAEMAAVLIERGLEAQRGAAGPAPSASR